MADTNREPWYKSTTRWGQTNLTELDPTRYDAEWWRGYWRRTRIKGIIVNAAGIVVYYPSKFPEVHRALYLGERDLFGEIISLAHEDGLAVLARMDSNRVDERFYIEHPDWAAIDADGRPYRAGDLYVTCINSPYYREFLPAVMREVIERYQPEGFTDNSYSGLGRESICYCPYCAHDFKTATGMDLPRSHDWDAPAYRKWIEWSYAKRIEIWDLNNRTTREAGGKDCLWVGMVSGDMVAQSSRFRDYKAIFERTEIVMLDSQARRGASGFQKNGEAGKLIHNLLGWDKLIPESTAMYQGGGPTFRVAAKPPAEARMWALEGFAGTIQPWWHHISAYHEDRRQYRTAEPLFRWHDENEEYLINRRPIANVGMLWSQKNVDFYGRNDAEWRITLPWRGMANAMIRARIPYLPVHADTLPEVGDAYDVLILPNVGALSDEQCESIRRFIARGGSLIATGESSLYDEWGDARADFGLADVFGAHSRAAHHGPDAGKGARGNWDTHTYLRLSPELRAGVDGPMTGNEPAASGERHPVLSGFDETDILPFGGRLEVVAAGQDATVPMTFIPGFPIYPPETAWMRQPSTSLPGVVLHETGAGGRIAYLPADIDRCYGSHNLPDHGRLLANLIRWAAGGSLPLQVEGPGFIDYHVYRQEGRLILHLVNLTSAETWRSAIHELIPIGPLHVAVRLPEGIDGLRAELRVAGTDVETKTDRGWVHFDVPAVTDHEMVVVR